MVKRDFFTSPSCSIACVSMLLRLRSPMWSRRFPLNWCCYYRKRTMAHQFWATLHEHKYYCWSPLRTSLQNAEAHTAKHPRHCIFPFLNGNILSCTTRYSWPKRLYLRLKVLPHLLYRRYIVLYGYELLFSFWNILKVQTSNFWTVTKLERRSFCN